MPKIRKKTSKRVSTKQRVKVQKKVREHHRKSRRDAKKDTTWRSKKKQDPGIPNSFPYKEQLLNEIEQRRMQAAQARLEAREARKGDADTDDDSNDAEDEIASEPVASQSKGREPSTALLALPEMYTGTLDEFLSRCGKGKGRDIGTVVFALDARDPASWRVPQIEASLAKSKTDLVLGLTRADLVPREPLAAWIAHLEASTSLRAFPLCTPSPAAHGGKARAGAGIDALVAHLEASPKKGGARTKAQEDAIAVVGIENAGRTLLANILAASLPNATVYDTPALLPASSRLANLSEQEQTTLDQQEAAEEQKGEDEDSLLRRDQEATHRVLIRNAGGVYKVREPMPLIAALALRVANANDLMIAYNTPAFNSTNDFLIGVARSSGRLKKGAVPDTLAAARNVLFAWSTGQIGYYTLPPSATTPEQKSAAQDARKRLDADKSLAGVVLPRQEWRARPGNKELRLKPSETGLLGGADALVAFAKSADVDEADAEDVEEDEDDEDAEMDASEDASEAEDEDDVDFEADEDDLDKIQKRRSKVFYVY